MVRSAAEVERLSRQALAILEAELPIEAAFLFGSYVEGRASEGSDIDLAIFTQERPRLRLADRSRLQLRVQRNCAPDMELHFYSAESLQSARPTNFYGYLLKSGKRIR